MLTTDIIQQTLHTDLYEICSTSIDTRQNQRQIPCGTINTNGILANLQANFELYPSKKKLLATKHRWRETKICRVIRRQRYRGNV
jgi:hypothetical protein